MHGRPERTELLDDSKTPLTVIAWFPRIVEQFKNRQVKYNDWGRSDQRAGRYPMIIYTLLAAGYIFLWGRKLLGEGWSLLPVILFLFDPLVLGHSGIIGSDIASAAVCSAVLFHLWQYLVLKKRKDFLWMSFFLGMACITKQNLVLLLFMVPIICLFNHLQQHTLKSFFSKKNIFTAIVAAAIVWLVINTVFYFHGSSNNLASYHFESNAFINLQNRLSFFSHVPLLLPEPFIRGVDMIQYHAQIGGGQLLSTYNSVTVWGHESIHHGFWFYYLAIGILKMPLPVILLGLVGLFKLTLLAINKKFKLEVQHIILLLPVLVFFVVLSLFNPFQIGIRHLLFLFPSMYILLALLIKQLASENNKARRIFVVFVLWQFISVACYLNNYIAYTNELAFDKTSIIQWVSDSSMDYGQNSSLPQKYVHEHPGFKLPDSIPSIGKFAVRAIKVLHTNKREPDTYAWLRKDYKPFGNYKGTVWLYDIKELSMAGRN